MDSLQSEGEKEEDDDDDDCDEMFNLNGVRATLLGAISKVSLADPSQWRLISIPMEYLQDFELSRWHPQHTPPRFLRLLLGFFTLLVCLVFWSHTTSYTPAFPTPNMEILNFTTSNRLPLIPPKIWQIYLSYSPGALAGYQFPMHSWISKSPSHSYTVLDGQGALAIVSKLSQEPKHAHILPTFYAMSRRVLRADFLRYLMLAIEGGVYSDIDTELLKPIHEWVPDEYKLKTRLVVGLEADQSPPVAGTTYEVQFCQWTLAGAADHPALWMMVDQILEKVKKRPFHDPPKDIDYSDDEVLDITGPAGWTETVFEYLNLPENRVGEEMVTWRNLTGMKKPKLYGDVLILPINGFATGVPHSGAAEGVVDDTFVKHQFAGAWRGGDH